MPTGVKAFYVLVFALLSAAAVGLLVPGVVSVFACFGSGI